MLLRGAAWCCVVLRGAACGAAFDECGECGELNKGYINRIK